MNSISMNFENIRETIEVLKLVDAFVSWLNYRYEDYEYLPTSYEYVEQEIETLSELFDNKTLRLIKNHNIYYIYYFIRKETEIELEKHVQLKGKECIKRFPSERANNYRIIRRIYDEMFDRVNYLTKFKIYNYIAKKEIDRRNRRYALNVLMYRTRLPQELVLYEVSKF